MKKKMSKVSFLFVLTFVISIVLVTAHGAQDEMDQDHHDGGMMSGFYGGMYGMGLFGWTFMVLIIVALVLFIVWLVQQLQEQNRISIHEKRRKRK